MTNSSKYKIPIAFIIAALIFCSIQVVIYCFRDQLGARKGFENTFDPNDRLPGIEETIIAWQLRNIQDNSDHADIVLLGDSSCLVGLDPILMEHDLRKKVLNMGTIGWLMAEGHTDLLEAFIKKHGAPKLVVYHLSEELMELSQHYIDEAGFLTRLREYLGKKEHKDNFDIIPSYKYRKLLRKSGAREKTVSDFKTMPRGAWPSAVDMFDELSRTKGHVVDPTPGTFEFKGKRNYEFNDNIYPGILRLGRLAEKYNFKIYFVYSPIPKEVLSSAATEFKGLEEKINERLGPYSEFILRKPLFMTLDDSSFQTQYTHLNAAGAKANTQKLIEDIKQLHLLRN